LSALDIYAQIVVFNAQKGSAEWTYELH
jgi:hypothetical protein